MNQKVTIEGIRNEIVGETYYVFPDTTVTVCLLTLKNGFHVVGSSACVSPANFDKKIGEVMARDNALNKCWELLGFRLLDKIKAEEGMKSAKKE